MLKKCLITLVLVSLSFSSAFSYTAFYSGSELREICKSSKDECTFFIVGALDAINLTQGNHPVKREICQPVSLTIGQVRQTVEKYMSDHHERLHFPAAALVHESMTTAFPCK